jgi:hypothetical protein
MRLSTTALTTTVPIVVPAGSAAAPAIALSEANTGIYRSANERLSFAAGGQEGIRLYNTGQVDFLGGAGSTNFIFFSGNNTSLIYNCGDAGWTALQFKGQPSNTNRGQMYVFSDGSFDFRPASTTSVKIKATGLEGSWTDFGTQNASSKLQKLTQAQYDGITPDANTIYFIVG